MITVDPLQAADLSNMTLSMPDGSFTAQVGERITGETYRVRLLRFQGRDVDFTMPLSGWCAGELYRHTKQMMAMLIPAWAA
jgi:hypothetical protein